MGKRRIRKETGEFEEYRSEKVRSSLLRCGADELTADAVCRELDAHLPEDVPSRAVRRAAERRLRSLDSRVGMRYTLKQAIFRLGPSGYPFERFMGRILSERGFRTQVGVYVEGVCIRHEVDVVAENERERWMVECKYHNRGGKATDAKTALYIHARFQDVERAWRRQQPRLGFRGVLATNTRLSTDARDYAECAGLDVISWRYPPGGSLEAMIESDRLYPVTILPSATRPVASRLIALGAVLARDVTGFEPDRLIARARLSPRVAARLVAEAHRICNSDDSACGTSSRGQTP